MNQTQERLLSLLSYAPLIPGGDPKNLGHAAWKDEDWEAVAAEARRHGLGPFLFHKLSTGGRSDRVPTQVNENLRNEYFRGAAANMRRFQLLAPALKALQAAGVPTIVLKGAYLAEAVYDNIALRTMSDVDILVRKEDLRKADLALSSIGLRPEQLHRQPSDDSHEFQYQHSVQNVRIDVHWELISADYGFTVDMADIWSAAVPARIAGIDVLSLSPEDLLIHLGFHATTHLYTQGLRPLCDISEVFSRLAVNGNLLGEKIRKIGAVRAVGFLILSAKRFFQAPIPENVCGLFHPDSMPDAIWKESREILLLNTQDGSTLETMHPAFIIFFSRKHRLKKIMMAVRKAFPSKIKMSAHYPVSSNSPKVFLYYPRRIWDVFKRSIPTLRLYVSAKNRRSPIYKNAAALMDWLLTRE